MWDMKTLYVTQKVVNGREGKDKMIGGFFLFVLQWQGSVCLDERYDWSTTMSQCSL